MKKLMKTLLLAAFAVVYLAGCSEQIPPGHKGKILGPSGYNPEVLGEGRHWVGIREQLVLLDLTTNRNDIRMTVTMNDYDGDKNARPGLDMEFILSFRYRLRDNADVINTMFHDIKVDVRTGVTANAVYSVYAKPVIETAFRDVVSKYTPEEALANRASVNEAVSLEIQKRLVRLPIEVSDVVVTKMVLPKTIIDRIKANKDKELQIAQEQAQQAIDLTKRENSIVLAQKDAERNLIDAQAAAAQNKELQRGLSDQVLHLRELEIQKIYAEAFAKRFENSVQGDTVFMPYEAMQSPGAQMRAFSK